MDTGWRVRVEVEAQWVAFENLGYYIDIIRIIASMIYPNH